MLLKAFRPNLIDYINLSKVLDNYTRRRKCTSGESTVGFVGGGGGDIGFSLKNISSFLIMSPDPKFYFISGLNLSPFEII